MSVSNGQVANASVFNAAFVSKTVNSTTIGQVTLNNSDGSSGTSVSNIQRELNAFSSYTGKATNVAITAKPAWASNDIGASSDSLFSRIEAIQTVVGGKTAGGVLFGSLQQDAATFFWDNAIKALGIGTDTPSANFDLNGTLGLVGQSGGVVSGVISQGNESAFIRLTANDTSTVETIAAPSLGGDQLRLMLNKSGFNATITDTDNIVTGGTDIEWLDETLLLVLFDAASSAWYPLAGGSGGGGATVSTNFSGATITASASRRQKWRYVNAGSVTMTSIDFSLMEQGDELIIVHGSNLDEVLTIPSNLTNVIMNGDWVGTTYSMITFIREGARIVEMCRNGI